MRIVDIGRAVAALLSLSTFVFLFLHDSWRADNMFLVPDLILCAFLLAAALLPGRFAVAALPAAFAYTAGVLITSVFSYVVRGEFGLPSLAGVLLATVAAIALVRHGLAGREPASGRGSGGGARLVTED